MVYNVAVLLLSHFIFCQTIIVPQKREINNEKNIDLYSQNYSRDNCIIYQVVLFTSLGDFASWSWTSLSKPRYTNKQKKYHIKIFVMVLMISVLWTNADNSYSMGFLGLLYWL